jgi:addiction module HigA family antidote
MIRSFKHRGLKRLYERGDRSGIRPDLLDTVERILTVLDSATTPQALDLPCYRLHPLKGDL